MRLVMGWCLMLALIGAAQAKDTITTPLPAGGFCVVEPGMRRSKVVCDYVLPTHPRRYFGREHVRVRVALYLKGHGQLKCASTTVYDQDNNEVLSSNGLCY